MAEESEIWRSLGEEEEEEEEKEEEEGEDNGR
jgi:hypothetical protein